VKVASPFRLQKRRAKARNVHKSSVLLVCRRGRSVQEPVVGARAVSVSTQTYNHSVSIFLLIKRKRTKRPLTSQYLQRETTSQLPGPSINNVDFIDRMQARVAALRITLSMLSTRQSANLDMLLCLPEVSLPVGGGRAPT